jgi:hypothetical protein
MEFFYSLFVAFGFSIRLKITVDPISKLMLDNLLFPVYHLFVVSRWQSGMLAQ